MVFLTAALGLASIGASLYGASKNRDAQREAFQANLRQQQLARRQFGLALEGIDEDEARALVSYDEAQEILAGIAPEVLEGMDEAMRLRVASQVRREQQEAAQLQSQLLRAGLDSTTVGEGVQRSQRFGQAQSMGAIAQQFAGARAGVQMQARQLEAAGLRGRSDLISRYAAQRAAIRQNMAGFESSIQFQPAYDGTYEAIGNTLGSLANLAASYQFSNSGGASRAPAYTGNPWTGAPNTFFGGMNANDAYQRAFMAMGGY